mmetsp:Transcript_19285/g.43406  ORF Transcript_19285/g.43406 Transcript_19285/m.43406 type:complete len:213 (+) Transcript_19285:593-1231(+)
MHWYMVPSDSSSFTEIQTSLGKSLEAMQRMACLCSCGPGATASPIAIADIRPAAKLMRRCDCRSTKFVTRSVAGEDDVVGGNGQSSPPGNANSSKTLLPPCNFISSRTLPGRPPHCRRRKRKGRQRSCTICCSSVESALPLSTTPANGKGICKSTRPTRTQMKRPSRSKQFRCRSRRQLIQWGATGQIRSEEELADPEGDDTGYTKPSWSKC